MRDADWLLALLSDGEEHELSDIIRRSQEVRGHGLTVHSRISDLRAEGWMIEQRGANRNGRRASFYRLIPSYRLEIPEGYEVASMWPLPDPKAAA